MLGSQAIIYGCFIYLLLLIPNSVTARLCILFCATLLAGVGAVMRITARRLDSEGVLPRFFGEPR